MIDALIRWSLGHRTIVVALAAGFLLWGGWTASRIPLDVLPDLTAPTVTILAHLAYGAIVGVFAQGAPG